MKNLHVRATFLPHASIQCGAERADSSYVIRDLRRWGATAGFCGFLPPLRLSLSEWGERLSGH